VCPAHRERSGAGGLQPEGQHPGRNPVRSISPAHTRISRIAMRLVRHEAPGIPPGSGPVEILGRSRPSPALVPILNIKPERPGQIRRGLRLQKDCRFSALCPGI